MQHIIPIKIALSVDNVCIKVLAESHKAYDLGDKIVMRLGLPVGNPILQSGHLY